MFDSKFELAEERLNELEYRLIEIIQVKGMNKNEESLREMWDTTEHHRHSHNGITRRK